MQGRRLHANVSLNAGSLVRTEAAMGSGERVHSCQHTHAAAATEAQLCLASDDSSSQLSFFLAGGGIDVSLPVSAS